VTYVAVFPPTPSQALIGALLTAGLDPVPVASLGDVGDREPDTGWTIAVVEIHHDIGAALAMASKIRSERDLPVLVVADRTRTTDLAEGDDYDDFILSPIDTTELAVRIRRLTGARPAHEVDDEVLRHRDLELNTATYQATVAGRPIDLTYMEYELLRYFVEHQGRVWSREQILSKVWGYDYFGGSRTVDVHVRRLRAKLGEERSRWIITVRSVGYRFG
jgi:two-component system alkaline phosphatase synthesis response regulator PhoP